MTIPSIPPSPLTVTLDSGPVTLVLLDQLRSQVTELEGRMTKLRAEAEQLDASADSLFADAGAILAPTRTEWQSVGAASTLARIDELVAGITAADTRRGEMADRERRGLSGLLARLTDYEERRRLTSDRNRLAAELRPALTALAKDVTSITTPEADKIMIEARGESITAVQRRTEADSTVSAIDPMKQEVTRRQQAIDSVGFDALYDLAWLKTYGPPPVTTSLVLHKDEVPYLAVQSTLARQTTQTRFVGSSQGLSFPIGHTGIRYRVGSFGGKPVQKSVMASVDVGELVLTNIRIAFIGKVKTITVNLPKVVNVHIYTDGIAVSHEGKENADFFYLSQPQRFVFYLNYVTDGLGG